MSAGERGSSDVHYDYIGQADLHGGCHVDNDECDSYDEDDIDDHDDGTDNGLVRYADIASEMMAQLRQEQVDVIIAIFIISDIIIAISLSLPPSL